MNTVTFKVETLQDGLQAFADAWKTGVAKTGVAVRPEIAFASWDLMHKVLAPKRLDILKAMCGRGPISIREISRRVGRDFKGVHTDVAALLDAGIVERDGRGIVFPYDRIHVEFDIDAAA